MKRDFTRLSMLVRTYAPVGHTPVLRVPLTRDHLSAIGGITPDGRIAHANANRVVPLRAGHPLFTDALAHDFWQAAGHLGWGSHPLFQRDQSVPCRGGRQATPSGAPARIRPRSQSARGRLEFAQMPRTEKPVLPESLSLARSISTSQRTPPSSEADSPIVFSSRVGRLIMVRKRG